MSGQIHKHYFIELIEWFLPMIEGTVNCGVWRIKNQNNRL